MCVDMYSIAHCNTETYAPFSTLCFTASSSPLPAIRISHIATAAATAHWTEIRSNEQTNQRIVSKKKNYVQLPVACCAQCECERIVSPPQKKKNNKSCSHVSLLSTSYPIHDRVASHTRIIRLINTELRNICAAFNTGSLLSLFRMIVKRTPSGSDTVHIVHLVWCAFALVQHTQRTPINENDGIVSTACVG